MSKRDTAELLNDLIEETKQNQRWLRFLAWENVKDIVTETLEDPWEYHMYESLNGEKSISALIEGLPTSSSTAGRRLNSWQRTGIVIQTESGEYDKLISLDLLNIDAPPIEIEDKS